MPKVTSLLWLKLTVARKKIKKAQPLTNLSAEGRAKQFSEDFYADGGVIFCRFSNHSVDFMRVDTVKDHLKSKKHLSSKERKTKDRH